MIEHTLAIIKPDAVRKRAIGDIIRRYEAAGLHPIAMRMLQLTKTAAQGFYAVHRQRPFFESLTTFMASGPVVVLVLSGDDAITEVDVWSHIQVEARYSSAPGAADGYYRLWVNNNDHAVPDAERTGIVLETTATSDANFLTFSGYHQVLSGPRSLAWTDVRVGPSFDPGWAF